MKNVVFYYFFHCFIFSQLSYNGLNTWSQASTISYAGGGYLLSAQNNFKNAAMLVNSHRIFRFDIVTYPASINAKSLILNGVFRDNIMAIKINNINYGIFDGKNSENQETENFSASDTHIEMSFAKTVIKNKIIFGFNSGVFLSQIQNYRSRVFTFSPGFIFNLNLAKLGFTIQNFGKIDRRYSSYNELVPTSYIISIAKKLTSKPIELEFDQIYLTELNRKIFRFSGQIKFNNGLVIRGGTSSNRSDLMIDASFINYIFSDIGLGASYYYDDLIIDFGTYNYGPTGLLYGFGISTKF